MAYLQQAYDKPNRANTVGGAAANSTNVGVPDSFTAPDTGGPWTDFQGLCWRIVSFTFKNDASTPGSSPIAGCLYRPSGATIDGKITWKGVSSTKGGGGVCRFNTTSGGNGYAGIIFSPSSNPKFFFYKCINGVTTAVGAGGGYATGVTTPTNYFMEFIFAQIDSLTTQLTLNLYDQAAPTVVVATQTVTDTTASLQSLSGLMGIGMNSGAIMSDVTPYADGGPLTTGTVSLLSVAKTKAYPQMTAPSGGTPPRTYQWYISPVAGFTPGAGNLVSGATSLTPALTGLTANTTYYAICRTTDATSATADSAALTFSTRATGAVGYGVLGDSISRGFGLPQLSMRASTRCVGYMQAAGVDVYEVNAAVDGTTTATWVSGSSNMIAALALFASMEVNIVQVVLGTNDSKVLGQVSDTTYLTNLTSVVNALLGAGYKVIIHYSPGMNLAVAAGIWDSTSLTALLSYQVKINSLVNGTTKYLGDTTAYTVFNANPSYLQDAVHPNQTGADVLGFGWAKNNMATIPLLAPPSSAAHAGIWIGIGL